MPEKEEATKKSTTKKKTVKKKAAPKKKVVKKKASTKKAEETTKPKRTRKRGAYYIDRKELMAEIIASKEVDRMSDRLASLLTLLTEKYAKKSNWARYTYNDDMQAYARMMLVRQWRGFKPERSDNPFAYYTQCIKNSFKQYLKMEKKQRTVRDELLVDRGLNPSYTYSLEYEEKQRAVLHEENEMPVVDVTDS